MHKNHYEVLNLQRDCTSKDIKKSFIELSKKYHPDTSKNPKTHMQFVQVTEAYQVLSKADSRKNYDLGLSSNHHVNVDPVYTYESPQRTAWDDPYFYRNRDRSKDKMYENRPYYGIKGVERVPNIYVVLMCLGFTFIGVGLQIFAIRHSFTLNRDKMIEMSNSAAVNLKQARDTAEKNGNKLQIELITARLKNAAVPKSD